MKRTVLLMAALCAGGIATAQQFISFEASEGYTTGSLDGQNNWLLKEDDEVGSATAQVSANYHTDGTNSVKFTATNANDGAFVEAIQPFTPPATKFTITQDVYTPTIDDQDGSDLILVTGSLSGGVVTPSTGFFFSYDGTLIVLTDYIASEDDYDYQQVGTFEANTWYQLKEEFDTEAGTVNYYLNDELVYEGNLLTDGTVNALDYAFDRYTTSFYLDNINISTNVAGVNQPLATRFSVYPNPATNSITVSNTVNAVINSITVTDINGRTVQSIPLNGAANAQVNVAGLAAGVYILNIATDQGTTAKKIIKN